MRADARRPRVTLIHHPTAAVRISGFAAPPFDAFVGEGIYLGNIYRRIIPQSLAQVAAVLARDCPVEVEILDLRILDPDREEVTARIDWEGYALETSRVGGAFEHADEAIERSDWIGLSSHFTFESRQVVDLMAHAKRRKPAIRIMVGGADAKARPQHYLRHGADLVFRGDFDPEAFNAALTSTARDATAFADTRHPFRLLTRPAFEKLEHLAEYTDSHDGPVPDGVSHPIGFVYFTRGCPRECDFCESRLTRFEILDLESCIATAEHYKRAGIRCLNFSDDNLLLRAAKPAWRAQFVELFAELRRLGFAWEFPNGLELGRLVDGDGVHDDVIEALFAHETDPVSGRIVGAYRVYAPVETFDARTSYRKLKPIAMQNRVIERIASCGLPEMNFGVVLPPNASVDTFESIRRGYLEIKEIVERAGDTRARYSIFHLIPISLYRAMATKYSVDELPEGWNFYFPVYDGAHFSARELFERRLRLVREIDRANFESMKMGRYAYA